MKNAVVLVVDDDETSRRMLVHHLQKIGIGRVLEAEDGHRAMARLQVNPPDLVLLDVMMPGPDGHEVLSMMRADPGLRCIPVIMITAVDDMRIAVQCIEMGAEDYLQKPFNPVMLRARISACIEKLRLQQVEREYLRNYDPSTGLPNRHFFLGRLEEELQRHRVSPSLFGLLLIQLGKYHVIQESLGQGAVENYIVERAGMLKGLLPENALLARIGDNAFAALLVGMPAESRVNRMALQIHQELSRPMMLQGHDILGSARIGVAFGSSRYDSADALLRDAALAAGKVDNPGGFRIFDTEMHEDAMRRLKLEPELRKALEDTQLVLYYQPVISLGNGNISGFEALIRWMHPERGFLLPDQFIRLAEETRLIVPLGYWILKEVSRRAAEWGKWMADDTDFSISANVSALQFDDPDFISNLKTILEEADISGFRVDLELTETALVANPDKIEAVLKEIRAHRIKTTMDDFGTGYCSLNYLHRFPFDRLKIDQSFIRNIHENPRNRDIVRSTVNLSHQLGMSVVAEGIETTEEAVVLRDMGCEYAQGAFFNMPMPESKAGELLRQNLSLFSSSEWQ